MIGFGRLFSTIFSASSSPFNPLYFWALVLLLGTGLGFGLHFLMKTGLKLTSRETKWIVILGLLVLPANVLAAIPFKGQTLTSLGTFAAPTIFIFSLLPSVVALGFVGPLPAVLLALVSGMIQFLIKKQDPMISLLLAGIVLAFTWFSSRVKDKETQEVVTEPAFCVLLSLAGIVPVGFLLHLGNAIVYTQQDYLEVLRQSVLTIFCLLPPVLIASATVQAIKKWAPSEWRPFDFVNTTVVNNPLNFALSQIDYLLNGNYEQAFTGNPGTQSEKLIYKSLEELRENLRLRNDTQSRLLSLDPAHYSREGYDLVLTSVLRAALGRDASSARLILVNQRGDDSKPEMRLRIGQGENTRLYAYLDVMILDRIGDQDQLILSNLKVDQYFGLTSGMPYPQSIAALHLKHEGNSQGILWVGFEQNHWFSQDDIKFYQQLAFRASAVLSTKDRFNRVQNDKQWLSTAFDVYPEPIFILNKEDQILFSNKKAAELSQTDGDLLEGNGERKSFKNSEFQQLLKKAKSKSATQLINAAKTREFECSVFPMEDGNEVLGKLLILQDTARIKLINSQKNEFVTNISHDLRSPLSLMKGYTRLLLNIGNLSEEQQKYVGRIEGGIENMSRLVNKVLSLERLDGEDPVEYSTFDVKELINETISMLSLQAEQRKITLNTDFGGMKTSFMSADRVLLHQALYNLIENAIKFSTRGGAVLISVDKDNSWMHFAIKDRGKGIAPLDQPKLFTRFFHVDDDEHYETRGQGLGLAIVKSIADRHGGKIRVESQLGEGSTFFLDIPIRK